MSLRSEASSLDQRMNRTRSELIYARDQHIRAERELRRFDRQREVRERLARETSYDRDVREARDKRSDLALLERELSRLEVDLRAKEQALRTCQATAGADCTSQQAAASAARSARDVTQSQRNTAKNDLETIERRIRNIEDRIEREVDREYNILADRERNARRQLDQLESSLASDSARYSMIMNSEIPGRLTQINQLVSEQNTLERNIPYIESRIATLENELAAFRKRTDWDRKKANLDNAQADFNQKANAHEAALTQEGNLVRTIEHCKAEKPRLEKLLLEARTLLSNTKARQAIVAKALEPFYAKKAQLDAEASVLTAQIGQMARDFEAKIPR